MLAPTFDILEDTDVYTDDSSNNNIVGGGFRSTKKSGGLGLRPSLGPNRGNIRALGGPQKPGGVAVLRSSSSSLNRQSSQKATMRRKPSAKPRAFGAVLATNNTAVGGGAPKANKVGPKGSRTKGSRAKSAGRRKKQVTAIEICPKPSGPYNNLEEDAEFAELMQTNKNAEALYRNIHFDAMVGGSGLTSNKSSRKLVAPVDDDMMDFGIFEDGDEEDDGNSGRVAGTLLNLETATLW